jgi:hypothetical protein
MGHPIADSPCLNSNMRDVMHLTPNSRELNKILRRDKTRRREPARLLVDEVAQAATLRPAIPSTISASRHSLPIQFFRILAWASRLLLFGFSRGSWLCFALAHDDGVALLRYSNVPDHRRFRSLRRCRSRRVRLGTCRAERKKGCDHE